MTRPKSPVGERFQPSPAETLLTEKYREGIKSHLNHLPSLFRSFTGLSSRISWAPAWPHEWSEKDLPIQFPLCRCLISRTPESLARCRQCARRHLKVTLRSGHAGHRFTCFRGVHNCWQPVIVRQQTVGLVFVQALDSQMARRCGSKQSRPPGRGCRSARILSRAEFNRSTKLLRLIFEHAESLTLADLHQSDLRLTQQALLELQTVAGHLREDLNGLIPAVNRSASVLQEESRSEQVVHEMLNYILRNYDQGITLKECARKLRLSTAYLSNLFSQRVGMPFKAYLTDIRLEKARELLGSKDKNISEIATAVGYGSENRFRIAFKQASGLSPKAWRETLHLTPAR